MNILKVVFKNALVNIGLSVLLFTGVLLGLRIIPYNLAGPVFGAAITLFATGLYSVTNYLSTTTTLSHEFDVECGGDDCRSGRISALVRNEGGVVVRDAKGVASIAVVRGSNRERSLKGLLVRDACEDRGMLVNEVNPHVIGEALAWGLPETTYWSTFKTDNQPVNANYAHITSISPEQRSRLLIFDYEYNWWGGTYVIKVYSEYGGLGPNDPVKRPYRACLLLDNGTKYEFEITVHGEGLREPLGFKMFVIKDKLNALVRSGEIARLGGEGVVMDVLKEIEEDGDEGFIDRYWRIRNRILEVKSLDEYKSVAKELESLWKSVKNKLGSKASYFGIATGILNSYLVYLAAIGKQDEAKNLFTENKETLKPEIESNVLTKLMLRLFRVEGVKVEVNELIDLFEKRRMRTSSGESTTVHVEDYFMPALKLIFGIYSDEKVALSECDRRYSENILKSENALLRNKYILKKIYCEYAVKALFSDVNALGNLSNSIFQALLGDRYEELKQFSVRLDAKNLILAYSPETPHARLALILHMLGQGDAKSVGALAYVGWKMPSRHAPLMVQVERYKQLLDQIGNLFREVYDACSNSNCSADNYNERLKLALLKLYHRLV
ncbi:hypothetical protein [Vulcanisaeta sp. EB80]|uniref:hypothetical protein n=1 Tax=Vulcanisaeta sp. EB80 TaxID=1650660 RepID=UPI00117FC166|nr:hypothetical protein [Vulcanisaeta sp. EB80]